MLYSPFVFLTYFAMMLGFTVLATMSSGSYTLPRLSMWYMIPLMSCTHVSTLMLVMAGSKMSNMPCGVPFVWVPQHTHPSFLRRVHCSPFARLAWHLSNTGTTFLMRFRFMKSSLDSFSLSAEYINPMIAM